MEQFKWDFLNGAVNRELAKLVRALIPMNKMNFQILRFSVVSRLSSRMYVTGINLCRSRSCRGRPVSPKRSGS